MYALYRAHEQRTGAGPNPHVVTPIFQAVLDVIGQDSPNLGGLDDVIVGDTETIGSAEVLLPPDERAARQEAGQPGNLGLRADEPLPPPGIRPSRWCRTAARRFQRRSEELQECEAENIELDKAAAKRALDAAEAVISAAAAAKNYYEEAAIAQRMARAEKAELFKLKKLKLELEIKKLEA
ncbi:hypothetical protein ISCGN_010314 [Ixodes scapularis]